MTTSKEINISKGHFGRDSGRRSPVHLGRRARLKAARESGRRATAMDPGLIAGSRRRMQVVSRGGVDPRGLVTRRWVLLRWIGMMRMLRLLVMMVRRRLRLLLLRRLVRRVDAGGGRSGCGRRSIQEEPLHLTELGSDLGESGCKAASLVRADGRSWTACGGGEQLLLQREGPRHLEQRAQRLHLARLPLLLLLQQREPGCRVALIEADLRRQTRCVYARVFVARSSRSSAASVRRQPDARRLRVRKSMGRERGKRVRVSGRCR